MMLKHDTTEIRPTEPDKQRVLWLAVRQALLLLVGAIERAYNLESKR